MTLVKGIWLLLAILYAAFFSWYTSFGGPLSAAEISDYLARFEQRSPAPDAQALDVLRRFMEEDTGDDFVMVNYIDMFDTPRQVAGVQPADTSAQVLDRYMAYMWPALLSRACHPIFVGNAANTAMDLMNADGMHVWSSAAGMRYRSRRDLMDIAVNPAFSGAHDFKIAAMRKTIAFPVDPWFYAGDPRLLLALVFGLLGSGVSWLLALRKSRQV